MVLFLRKQKTDFIEGEGLEEFDEGIVPSPDVSIMARLRRSF